MSYRDTIHVPRKVNADVQRRIDALEIGQKMQDLPEELWHESFRKYMHMAKRGGGPNLRMIRLDPAKPALTVTGFIFNKFVHPTRNRFITPREAACLQGFPKDFAFSGVLTSVQRQIGNAVPSQLAQAVAKQILLHMNLYHPSGIGRTVYKTGKYPSISAFSGAGGMDVGFAAAHVDGSAFQIAVDIEYDRDCCNTLRKNFPDAKVHEERIENTDISEVLGECTLEGGVLPLLFGGPPCQAFSQAGKQKASDDERGTMIFRYLDFIQKANPVYFVLENVSNLHGVSGGAIFNEVRSRISEMGYKLSVDILSSDQYGAPQRRKRMIFIGVKGECPPVPLPQPTHGEGLLVPSTVGDAFRDLPEV